VNHAVQNQLCLQGRIFASEALRLVRATRSQQIKKECRPLWLPTFFSLRQNHAFTASEANGGFATNQNNIIAELQYNRIVNLTPKV